MKNNQQINTIIEPDAIAFSFEAIGWTIVLYILIASIIFIIGYFSIKYYKNRYRRLALLQLERISNSSNHSLQKQVSQTNTLLKQVYIHKYGRNEAISTDGELWLNFLNKKIKHSSFDRIAFIQIQQGLYNETVLSPTLVSTFINQSKIWIQKHVV